MEEIGGRINTILTTPGDSGSLRKKRTLESALLHVASSHPLSRALSSCKE